LYNKALVTGGAGFIGSFLCRGLIDRGIKTVVLDDLSSGSPESIPSNVELIVGSVTNPLQIKKALDGVEVVFHLAGKTTVVQSSNDYFEVGQANLTGTLCLLFACENKPVKKIVFASSASVYREGVPGEGINERYPTGPLSPYGVSKLLSERFIQKFSKETGVDYVILRYFNVFGPGQEPVACAGVITRFAKDVLVGKPPEIRGDGSQTRDFVHVEDIVNATFLAMDVSNQTINVGSGKPTSVRELANIIIKETGSSIRPVYIQENKSELKNSLADISKAINLLGYNPDGSVTRVHEVLSFLKNETGV
jgi:UDP-glucose 4-epimerase